MSIGPSAYLLLRFVSFSPLFYFIFFSVRLSIADTHMRVWVSAVCVCVETSQAERTNHRPVAVRGACVCAPVNNIQSGLLKIYLYMMFMMTATQSMSAHSHARRCRRRRCRRRARVSARETPLECSSRRAPLPATTLSLSRRRCRRRALSFICSGLSNTH